MKFSRGNGSNGGNGGKSNTSGSGVINSASAKSAARVSKRLVMAIIGFVLSLAMCLGMCLAWFAINESVDSNGSNVKVDRGDVIDFSVDVYYLDSGERDGYKKAATGNTSAGLNTYNVDDQSDGALTSEADKMRPYGALGASFATAVLFVIHYEIRPSEKTYRIVGECGGKDIEITPTSGAGDSFDSALSNAVGFYYAAQDMTGGTEQYAKQGMKPQTFVDLASGDGATDNEYDKYMYLKLKENIAVAEANNANGNFEETTYLIMDYVEASFIYLSALMVANGGSLTSALQFSGDLNIYLEAYDETTPDPGFQGGGTDTPQPHEHTYVYEEFDDNYHNVTCSGCTEVNRQEPHDSLGDGGACSKCGYKKAETPQSKSWNITFDSDTHIDNDSDINVEINNKSYSNGLVIGSDSHKVTITLNNLAKGQTITLTVNGRYTSNYATGVKIESATNVNETISADSDFNTKHFDTTDSDITFTLTVKSDGSVEIVLARNVSHGIVINSIKIDAK